jgi:hypothetical protein
MINFLLWLILALFGSMILISFWITFEIGKPRIIEDRQYKSECWGNKQEKNKLNNFDNIERIIASKYERS